MGWGMSDQNDIIYGAHPVEEALKNPKRKIVKLTTTLNAAERLREFTQPLKITPQIVNPKVLDRLLGPDAVPWSCIVPMTR